MDSLPPPDAAFCDSSEPLSRFKPVTFGLLLSSSRPIAFCGNDTRFTHFQYID
jgi:hypothetical protein